MHHADDERTQLTINELLSYVRTIARSMRHSEEHMPFYFTFCAWNRKPSPGVFVRGAPLWLRLGLGGGWLMCQPEAWQSSAVESLVFASPALTDPRKA
jgi:hypothetical protein